MEFIRVENSDVYIIKPTLFFDERGSFSQTFREDVFSENGISFKVLQENTSFSKKNVFRGLHYQKPPFSQAKLVRCLQGKIMDFAVDIRKKSPYFGTCICVELSGKTGESIFIPKGFAHGFLALEDSVVSYKTDSYYCKEAEQSIHFSDDFLKIPFLEKASNFILSEKDKNAPTLEEIYKKEIHFW